MIPRLSRRWTALTALLLCLSLVAGCSPDDPVTRAGPDHVRAVVLPFLTQSPFQIAAEEGYFEERGLEVEFVRLPRIQDVNTALARGEVDAAAGMFTVALMNSVVRGGRVRLVATLGHLQAGRCPFHGWVTRRELAESGRLDDPDSVAGLRIDVELVLPDVYFFSRILTPMGLSLDGLELVSVPPTASAEMLLNGNTDVAGLPQPHLDLALRDDELVLWKGTNEILPGYPISLLMYGPTLLDERPEVGRRLVDAILEATERFREGKTRRNIDILQKFTGLEREQVATTCWPVPPEDPRVDYAHLRDYSEWAVARGLSDRVVSEEEAVDHRFVDEVRGTEGVGSDPAPAR